jgi:hypothetical protein
MAAPRKDPIDLRTSSRGNLIARRSRPRRSLRRRLHRTFLRESRLSQDFFLFPPDFFVRRARKKVPPADLFLFAGRKKSLRQTSLSSDRTFLSARRTCFSGKPAFFSEKHADFSSGKTFSKPEATQNLPLKDSPAPNRRHCHIAQVGDRAKPTRLTLCEVAPVRVSAITSGRGKLTQKFNGSDGRHR